MKKIIIPILIMATAFFSYQAFKLHMENYKREKLASVIQKHVWFDEEPAIAVNTISEVQELWQSKKRCCEEQEILQQNNREFTRACYTAAFKHINNEPLVVKCLSLMSSVAEDFDSRYSINSYLIDNYIQHKNDISNCVNCNTGDIITRTAHRLSYHEQSKGNLLKAIEILENIITVRNDAALWIQVETLEKLGNLYLENNVTKQQKEFINFRYEQLLNASTNNEAATRRIPNLEKVLDKINSK